MQTQILHQGKLLDENGRLTQIGWSVQPMLDCNLEDAKFYRIKALQRFRIKRWDYYAVFSPRLFFSATIADLGYAGNIFVYAMDLETNELHEEGLVVPLSKGVSLPRNSNLGESIYEGKGVSLHFSALPEGRQVNVSWPSFHGGRGISANIRLQQAQDHESMTIVIPIGKKRFYYNRKINCLPAMGSIQYGNINESLVPDSSLGSLDWGRGVWEYKSFWNWASASGFLEDGRSVGLNLGCGFGDLSAATENCVVVNRKVHKLTEVKFGYDSADYMKPWKFTDTEGRLDLDFVPFKERLAQTNLGIIFSEVHQMFGRYSGTVITEEGDKLQINNLIGFAEEHQARW